MLLACLDLAAEVVLLEDGNVFLPNGPRLLWVDLQHVLGLGHGHLLLRRSYALGDVGAYNVQGKSFAIEVVLACPHDRLQVRNLPDENTLDLFPTCGTGHRLFTYSSHFTYPTKPEPYFPVEASVKLKDHPALINGGFGREARWALCVC